MLKFEGKKGFGVMKIGQIWTNIAQSLDEILYVA